MLGFESSREPVRGESARLICQQLVRFRNEIF